MKKQWIDKKGILVKVSTAVVAIMIVVTLLFSWYKDSHIYKIDDKEYSLKDALLESKITMEEIIQKANKDLDNNKITGDMYKDGGSMIYQYDTYTIIKCHTIEGNRDVYIGTKEMTLNDVK